MNGATLIGTLRSLAAQLAAFEALLLAASAAHKMVRWSHSRTVVRRFAGVPAALASATLAGVVLIELAAAAMLVMPAQRAPGALLAGCLWAAYLALIARAILQGRRDADCGCSFGSSQRPLGWFQLWRNALLLLLAAVIAWASPASGAALQGSQLIAAGALLALYGALDQVMALRPLRSGEVL